MATTELTATAPAMERTRGYQHAARRELRSIAHAMVGLIAATALGVVLELADHDLFTQRRRTRRCSQQSGRSPRSS